MRSTTNVTTNSVVHHVCSRSVHSDARGQRARGGGTNTRRITSMCSRRSRPGRSNISASTNKPNAAPGVVPTGTGQNNLFKYVAGLDPTNPVPYPNCRCRCHQSAVAGTYCSIRSRGSYVHAGSSARIWWGVSGCLWRGTLSGDQRHQISVTDTNAVDPQRFYRIDISLPYAKRPQEAPRHRQRLLIDGVARDEIEFLRQERGVVRPARRRVCAGGRRGWTYQSVAVAGPRRNSSNRKCASSS